MKKLLALPLALLFFGLFGFAHADVGCSQVAGGSIYGDQSEGYGQPKWTFIGTVTNEYSSDSIANQYGDYGSKYSDTSIFDEYGTFGSEFNDVSAMDKFANNPPILVTTSGQWGYLTMNEFKTPAINPYFALSCAQSSY